MLYTQIRPDLQTGYIVLFAGTVFFSWIIRIFSGDRSHVGMVVRHGKRILLFDSNATPGQNGPGLHYLSQAIQSYKGRVWIRKLEGVLTLKMLADLDKFIKEVKESPYEKDLIELVGAVTPWHIGKFDALDWFCTELIARVYQIWGIIPEIPLAKEYSPGDFKLGGAISQDLNRAYALGSEIPIEKVAV
jgi:starvation-inducible outer membrane lipoprotein